MTSIIKIKSNTESYPIILIPSFISEIHNQELSLEEVLPNYKEPKRPFYPQKISLTFFNYFSVIFNGFFVYLGVGIFFLIISRILSTSLQSWQTFWLFYTIASCILMIALLIFVYIGNKRFNQQAIDNYYIKLREYNEKIKKNKLLQKEMLNNESFVLNKKINKLKKILDENKKTIFLNSKILNDNEIKKGPTEILFYEILNKYSNFSTYKSLKYRYYYPDIVIVKDNIVIDLEIDEPYTLETLEPIHYGKTDNDRDSFFIDNNFVVIRFTEEQILKNPLLCIQIINEVFDFCMKNVVSYVNTSDTTFINHKWTYEQCFEYAYNKSRSDLNIKIKNIKNKLLANML